MASAGIHTYTGKIYRMIEYTALCYDVLKTLHACHLGLAWYYGSLLHEVIDALI